MYERKGIAFGAVVGCLGLFLAGCSMDQEELGGEELVDRDVAALGTSTVASAPSVVAAFGKARLDVFFRNPANQLVQRTWTLHAGWSGDIPLSPSNFMTDAPSCVSRLPQVIDCFVRRPGGLIMGNNYNGSTWTGWLDVTLLETSASPAATVTGNNQVDLFFIGGETLGHLRWKASTAWRELPGIHVGITQGGPSCASVNDGTWSCAILGYDNGKVQYYAGRDEDTYTQQEFDSSTSVEPSVFVRENFVYTELFYRIQPTLDVAHAYFHSGDPVTTEIRTDMSSLVDMPRCAPWGTNEMLCFSRDASQYLIYSFYTHPSGSNPTGSWTPWARQ